MNHFKKNKVAVKKKLKRNGILKARKRNVLQIFFFFF